MPGVIERLDRYFSICALTKVDDQLSVDDYVRRVLMWDFSSYYNLGSGFIVQTLLVAHRDLDCLKLPWPFEFPEPEWRSALMSSEDFEDKVCGRHHTAEREVFHRPSHRASCLAAPPAILLSGATIARDVAAV